MYLRLLDCSSKPHKVKGNAVVAFKFHMDRLFGEASTRKTNAAGYLIQIRESTPQLEPGGETEEKKGGVYQNTSTGSGHRPSLRMVA